MPRVDLDAAVACVLKVYRDEYDTPEDALNALLPALRALPSEPSNECDNCRDTLAINPETWTSLLGQNKDFVTEILELRKQVGEEGVRSCEGSQPESAQGASSARPRESGLSTRAESPCDPEPAPTDSDEQRAREIILDVYPGVWKRRQVRLHAAIAQALAAARSDEDAARELADVCVELAEGADTVDLSVADPDYEIAKHILSTEKIGERYKVALAKYRAIRERRQP